MEAHSVAYAGISAFKTQETPYGSPTAASPLPPYDVAATKDVFEKFDFAELEANQPEGSRPTREQGPLAVRIISHLVTYYAIIFLSQFAAIVFCINGIISSSRKGDRESGGFMVLCLLSFTIYLPCVDMAASYRKKNSDHYISSRLSFLLSIFSFVYLLADPSSMYRSPACSPTARLDGPIDDRCKTTAILLFLQCFSIMASYAVLLISRNYPESDPISRLSSIHHDRRAQGIIGAMLFYLLLTFFYRYA